MNEKKKVNVDRDHLGPKWEEIGTEIPRQMLPFYIGLVDGIRCNVETAERLLNDGWITGWDEVEK